MLLGLELGGLIILLFAILFALYAAWGGGANDVANAMGTSVGSGALTLTGAIIVATIFEFAGAVLVGSKVTETVRKGIVDPVVIGDPHVFIAGMMAAMAAAALWLTLATFWSMPVSTTHSIVGAIVGFGLVAGGPAAVEWDKMQEIVMGWLISPLLGAVIALGFFMLVKRTVLDKADPVAALRVLGPWYVGFTVVVLAMATIVKGLKPLKLDLTVQQAFPIAIMIGVVVALILIPFFRRRVVGSQKTDHERYQAAERLFVYLQIATACSVAFAHGANDVANAVGPLAGIWVVLQGGIAGAKATVPIWIFVLGGAGIVLGLATYGTRVMATIGKKITEVTPSRGFAAELSAAIVILVASQFGLPVSTTHTLVGCVIGVGLARGIPAIDLKVVGQIMLSWAVTLPIVAATAAGLYLIILPFMG